MSDCARGDCAWSPWRGAAGITDMLTRQCAACGERQIRILPPDVRAPDVRREDEPWMGFDRMVEAYGQPEEWGK